MRSKEIENYKRKLSLTDRQKQILIGCLLGDAHLESQYRPEVARLKIEHSYKQKDYVDWLYREFKEWVRMKPKERERETWGKVNKHYYFTTLSHPDLAFFRKMFYKHRTKIAPIDFLTSRLTELSLAVWYMDDGSVKSKNHKGVFLNTQGFTRHEIENLKNILKNRFDVESTSRNQRDKQQIYLGSKSGEKFIALIREYIIPSMEYKIPQVLRLT